ncbi:hypothetical protein HWV62_35422 [Athelia sp. TMB]|nr:hypothetical protein HWV62_35422 [Athelia sp. TMB]
MATETQTTTAPSSPPTLTSLTRVASIPLVSSSLDAIHNTLSTNAYTKSPYHTATGLAYSALGYSEPLQVRLAPLTTRADGFANKGLDAVESRFPYPFQAKPEEIVDYARERRQSTISAVDKAIDERVRSPAKGVAQGIDQRFAPIVDYFEVQVNKLHTEAGPSSPTTSEAQYQYQRAYALSRNLTENLYVYSNENLKQLQAQSAIVQRATATAHTITDLATSSLANAQTRIHTLSDSMLAELQRVQANTAALPAALQSALQSSTAELSAAIAEFRETVSAKDVALNEKAARVGAQVRERVNPILEGVQLRVRELVGLLEKKKEEAVDGYTNGVNGTNGANGPVNGK